MSVAPEAALLVLLVACIFAQGITIGIAFERGRHRCPRDRVTGGRFTFAAQDEP